MGRRKKILIIKPSSLGDIVHSLPVLDVLHRCFPDPEIHWLVAKGFEGMLEGHPMLKKLWIIHKDLKAENFDYVIDLQGLLRSGVIAKATGAPVRVGFAEAREGSRMFYTHTVAGGREVHAVDRYLKVPAFLGCDISEVRFPLPPFDSSLEAVPSEGSGYAVMCPGARKPVNRWPAERFGKLASMLPLKTVVVGSKGDRRLADEVMEASGGKALSIAGKTDLKGLIGIIKHARIMVTNDTGPMHIAAALGIPVFAIFGAANPARTGPYGDGHTIIRKEISCSPCYRRNCEEPVCMEMIKVKEVAAIINKFLEGQ
jgi:heptosyltransferase-1